MITLLLIYTANATYCMQNEYYIFTSGINKLVNQKKKKKRENTQYERQTVTMVWCLYKHANITFMQHIQTSISSKLPDEETVVSIQIFGIENCHLIKMSTSEQYAEKCGFS